MRNAQCQTSNKERSKRQIEKDKFKFSVAFPRSLVRLFACFPVPLFLDTQRFDIAEQMTYQLMSV